MRRPRTSRARRFALAPVALAAITTSCETEGVTPLYAPPADFVTNERIVYADGLHNENTEMIVLDDRILLIFRGGETGQIGSNRAHIDVYASFDGGATFAKQSEVSGASLEGMRDIRDPKLVAFDGKLHLYAISRLPGGHYRDIGGHAWTVRSESSDHGVTWTDPVKTFADVDQAGVETFWGFWRITKHSAPSPDGGTKETLYALGYDDGDVQVGMFASDDGVHWTKRSVVIDSYDDVPSEAELQFFGPDQATAVAIVRMDNQGILQDGQSAICTATQPFTTWECGRRVEQRFDGPTWLSTDGGGGRRNFMIARKHLPCTYKRTAVYELRGDLADPSAPITVCEIEELPSAGDTAYTAVASLGGDRWLTSWYSSEVREGRDLAWLDGTYSPADIWLAELDLSKAPVDRCHPPPAKVACAAPPLPGGRLEDASTGDYFLSLAPVFYPSQTLIFRAHLEVQGDTVDLTLQPLAKETGADVGGGAWQAHDASIDAQGRFTATFERQFLPLESFPLLEDPFLSLDGLVFRGALTSADAFCGSISGVAQVYGTSPADRIDLEGSTFGAGRIVAGVNPPPTVGCTPPHGQPEQISQPL